MGGQLEALIAQGLVLWVVIAGFAYMVRGPRGAGRVIAWPVVTAARLFLRAVGDLFVAFGNWIRSLI